MLDTLILSVVSLRLGGLKGFNKDLRNLIAVMYSTNVVAK